MTYDLWEAESRNLIGSYATEAEALSFVRAQVEDCGQHSVETWVLAMQDDARIVTGIATGDELVSRAQHSVTGYATA